MSTIQSGVLSASSLVMKQVASLMERNNRLTQPKLLLWQYMFWVFSYFWCKIWCHILARRWNFVPFLLSFRDLTRDRQTDNRCDDHFI